MADEKFKRLLDYRKGADREVHDTVMGWAIDEGLDGLTLGQINSLSSKFVAMNNRAARDAFDIGNGPSETTS